MAFQGGVETLTICLGTLKPNSSVLSAGINSGSPTLDGLVVTTTALQYRLYRGSVIGELFNSNETHLP